MPGVILHAGDPLDDPRDARQRPEVRAEAMRARALAQSRFDLAQLCRPQPRLAAGAAGGPQRGAPPRAPRAIPSQDALAADPQPSSNSTLRLARGSKQPRGLVSTYFQSMEIPSWRRMSRHTPSYDGKVRLSLYYARFNKIVTCEDAEPARIER
jgi:hypothetical protein